MSRPSDSVPELIFSLVVLAVLIPALLWCWGREARQCEAECEAAGMHANAIVTDYGVQCICTGGTP